MHSIVAKYNHPVSRHINHPALMVLENDFQRMGATTKNGTFYVWSLFDL